VLTCGIEECGDTPNPVIHTHVSSRDVAATQVVDYAAHALASGLEPMSVDIPYPEDFSAELRRVVLGGVTIAHGTGQDLRCLHGKREISDTSQRNYHLLINRESSWTLRHRGDLLVRANDAAIVDSALPYEFTFPPFNDTHIQLSESWMHQWLPDPGVLTGRAILRDSAWGAALCSFVRMLTPAFLVQAPLPPQLILDHVGALLSILAHDMRVQPDVVPRMDRLLREHILDTVRQRCTESGITATDIASTLKISTRTLHRHLAAFHQTFGGVLIDARADVATRMLESAAFRRLTIAEISRRSGFGDPSHFARVVNSRSGRTPLQIRRNFGTS
jgi:AraC-like DNA-binding protein